MQDDVRSDVWPAELEELLVRIGHRFGRVDLRRRMRALTHAWLVWDVQDSEWFSDCPVLLDLTGEQVEINHAKFDDLSITWNT
ncbi:hypothetical protein AB0N16_12585 [Streptomyces sp. NPDC051105]|uniref:hypothetical protein n=1 Tax=Streptomyces sp. NPDC051105 TaxID=3154843 RepID=UPI0034369A1C